MGLFLVAQAATAEMYRCYQPDSAIVFRAEPCALTEMTPPEPPARVRAPRAAPAASAAAARPLPPGTPAPERPVSVPAATEVAPAGAATGEDDAFVKPTRRKRELLGVSAQLARCRADAPGFAEQSASVYAAWTHRHAALLAEYDQLIGAKVRASRRGEATLPLRLCTEDWLRSIEPLARMPDPRFATVEKTWQVFLGALMTGDRATALSCLGGRAEARWKERTAALNDDDLRRLGASVRALKVQWGDDYEKEGLVADTDNRVLGIAFRNINEEWKIVELGGAPPAPTPAQ